LGRIGTRLARLEDSSREHAVAELRRAWVSLTDEEIALILAPYLQPEMRPEGGLDEEGAVEKARVAFSDELIAAAIGLTERMSLEERDRRMKTLSQRLGVLERGVDIRRHWRAVSESEGT
jgi:hypothetical protein